MNKEWKELDKDYIVSSNGDVGSRKKGGLKMMVPVNSGRGYRVVCLSQNGKQKNHYVHHLVAKLFLGPKPSPQHELNHIDGNKANNSDRNLEWVTPSENSLHRLRVLRQPHTHGVSRGEDNGFSKLKIPQVRAIRERLAAGEPHVSIAPDYSISSSVVSNIARKKSWAWVEP